MANYNLTQTGAEVQELLNKVSLFGKFTCSDAAASRLRTRTALGRTRARTPRLALLTMVALTR